MDKFSYSVGIFVAQNLKKQGIGQINAEDLVKGIVDVINDQPYQIQLEEANQILQQGLREQAGKQFADNLNSGKLFLEDNAAKEGVISLPSGLQYKVLKEGQGDSPKATDKVTTHYHGTLIDGQVFDSSMERGQPATFPVNGVIKGWIEALQLMKVGSKWRLFVPHFLAYGEQGAGEAIQPFSTLIFDVELLKIN